MQRSSQPCRPSRLFDHLELLPDPSLLKPEQEQKQQHIFDIYVNIPRYLPVLMHKSRVMGCSVGGWMGHTHKREPMRWPHRSPGTQTHTPSALHAEAESGASGVHGPSALLFLAGVAGCFLRSYESRISPCPWSHAFRFVARATAPQPLAVSTRRWREGMCFLGAFGA